MATIGMCFPSGKPPNNWCIRSAGEVAQRACGSLCLSPRFDDAIETSRALASRTHLGWGELLS